MMNYLNPSNLTTATPPTTTDLTLHVTLPQRPHVVTKLTNVTTPTTTNATVPTQPLNVVIPSTHVPILPTTKHKIMPSTTTTQKPTTMVKQPTTTIQLMLAIGQATRHSKNPNLRQHFTQFPTDNPPPLRNPTITA